MADRTPSTKALRFLFFGTLRDWKPLKGHTPPKGRVCELVSLPGNVVTWASTFEEASDKMRRALERGFKLRASAVRWYDEAMASMSTEQEQMLAKLWLRVFKEQRPTQTAKLPAAESYHVVASDAYHAAVEEPEPDTYEFAYFTNEEADAKNGQLCYS